MRKEIKDPEVIKGESRNPGATGKWTHLMGDVISSRTKIKRRNAQCETILQRYAEPLSLIGSLVGGEYMKTSLDLAWKYLLQNHPHDNICGAGIDQMEKDMMYRFDQCEILSRGILRRGLSAIVKNIDNNDVNIEEAVITVFNPSPFTRTEVLSISIDLPDKSNYEGFSLVDSESKIIPFKYLEEEPYGTLVRNLQDISLQLRSRRVKLITEFKDIPPLGYRTYLIKKETQLKGNINSGERSLKEKDPILENEFIRAEINFDGSLNILDKNSGNEFKNQNYYEESGEAGNPWIHMYPEENKIITTLYSRADFELMESSELMTRYKVINRLSIPVGLEKFEGGFKRSSKTDEMIIETEYTLRKGDRWVSIYTRIVNKTEHHRVRACFPSKLKSDTSAAEASFDVIERDITVKESSPYFGKPNPQYPMHRFVDVSDGKIGLAIFNDGIREYEAVPDDERTIAITLFRGFTATQSPVIDQWDVYPWMKLSQSLGLNEWRYAVMPHTGNWEEGDIYREAEKFNLPLQSSQSGKGGGKLPKDFSFIQIKPEKIALSALKRCERGSNLILRIFNPTDKDLKAELTFHTEIKNAWLTNMNEERKNAVENSGNKINVDLDHKKIQTIEVEI